MIAVPPLDGGMSASFNRGGAQMVAASISKLASGSSIRLTRTSAHFAGAAVALMLFGTSGALAQNCTAVATAPVFIGNINAVAGVPAATAGAIAGTLGNVSTAFLSQQTSAFV